MYKGGRTMDSTKEQTRTALIDKICRMGHPREFAELIASELGTEKQMARMISYLVQFRPASAETIADEMLAIKAEFEKYRNKKAAEYYNRKYNELLARGLEDSDEDTMV